MNIELLDADIDEPAWTNALIGSTEIKETADRRTAVLRLGGGEPVTSRDREPDPDRHALEVHRWFHGRIWVYRGAIQMKVGRDAEARAEFLSPRGAHRILTGYANAYRQAVRIVERSPFKLIGIDKSISVLRAVSESLYSPGTMSEILDALELRLEHIDWEPPSHVYGVPLGEPLQDDEPRPRGRVILLD